MVEVWGGGGAPRDCSCIPSNANVGIGGAGGGYGRGIYNVTPGVSRSVTVGRGGVAQNGGTSSFGTLISATGGSLGGGIAGIGRGQFNMNGKPGETFYGDYRFSDPSTSLGRGGDAGNGGWGGIASLVARTSGGVPGGGGGAGARNTTGGVGAAGRVVVWW